MDLGRVKALTERAFRQDWRHHPIVECGEPLVKVDPQHTLPWYKERMGLTTTAAVHLRETVYQMFLTARRQLQDQGYDLKVYDGWRPVQLQEALFWHYLQVFTATALGHEETFADCRGPQQVQARFNSLPKAEQAKLREENRKYVSLPSTNRRSPSPHATGGAVDVWLYRGGQPANLGVPFDWMDERAGAFHHLRNGATNWPSGSAGVQRNRSALLKAMVGAGFSCYPHEIWHFNFGNQMHGLVHGEPARYSLIQP